MADPIITPRRADEFFNLDGSLTLRAIRFFESLTETTNTNTTIIDETTVTSVTLSNIIELQQRIGSGQELTIDTTGFTVDTTKQTTDQTEA